MSGLVRKPGRGGAHARARATRLQSIHLDVRPRSGCGGGSAPPPTAAAAAAAASTAAVSTRRARYGDLPRTLLAQNQHVLLTHDSTKILY